MRNKNSSCAAVLFFQYQNLSLGKLLTTLKLMEKKHFYFKLLNYWFKQVLTAACFYTQFFLISLK